MDTYIERSSRDVPSPLPSMVLRGAFFGSILLCFLCCILTTGNTTVPATTIAQAAVAPQASTRDKQAQACGISKKYPASITQWCDLITSQAKHTGLSPDLLAALIWQESGGDPLAYSSSGAVGLMQVMPRDGISARFQCVNGPCFANRPSMEELQDPEFNVTYGSKMLSGLVNRYGNLRDALKAYGPMDVGYRYADIVLSIYKQYKK